MTVSVVKNMGASVRQRLLNYAKTNNRPFAEVLQYYVKGGVKVGHWGGVKGSQ